MSKNSYSFAERTTGMKASIIREILKVSSRPNVISFAGGLPAPETFPLKEFEAAVRQTLRMDGTKALQYMVTEGHFGLKRYLCEWLGRQGIHCEPHQMLLTHGSQQALDLLGKIFINPGDSIVMEDPTYLGAIQSFNAYQTKYETVPIDENGILTDVLEKKLKQGKYRFIYTMPTFQNPSGITMSLDRRHRLLDLASAARLPIIEDDPYGILRFKGTSLPSLYSLARGKNVVYMSTFSKLLSPGIRLGFLVAEESIIKQLVYAKQASDLQTNTFVQYAVYHYCRRGSLEKHIPKIVKDYERRAGVMMEAIRRYFPSEIKYYDPQGGMFVWCEMPKGIKASDVFKKAIQKKVAFVDGSVFYANGGGENTFRLNFTNSTDASIREGIKRLGVVLSTFVKGSSSKKKILSHI